ncbi:hypothetical protein DUI87_29845 [Hirundo rustica rustica]|uniref:Uncharacterized protein n=1 Tax=Hirundo rustica rustica TaxID=333673 RepID=A0A3M0J471_HIRRU|nr:hypothetical protein DUI87_29845 [Hirundo rustica rustica]
MEMAENFICSFTALCCLALWSFTGTSGVTNVPPPHATIRPGFPVPVNTNNPRVCKATRFGVYRYNNSSNDLFLFKEPQIKKAMVQTEKPEEHWGLPPAAHRGLDLSIFQQCWKDWDLVTRK